MEALQASLEMEKVINKAFIDLHDVADKHDDHHMADFVEG